MIGPLYSLTIGAESHSAPSTLIYIEAAAAAVSIIERMWIKQSDFDTSENQAVKVQRGTAAGTDTDVVPEPLHIGDTYGGVIGTNSTGEPTYTALAEIIEDAFNVLSGWLWTPASDDEVIVVTPAADVGIMLDSTPSAAMLFHYGCTIREIG